MKLNKLLVTVMFIGYLCFNLPNELTQASEVGTSTNTIYFPEDIGFNEPGEPDPKPSVKPGGKDETPEEPVSKPTQKPDKLTNHPLGFLPKTGEVKTTVLSLIGIIVLLLVGLTIYLKSKKINKNQKGE